MRATGCERERWERGGDGIKMEPSAEKAGTRALLERHIRIAGIAPSMRCNVQREWTAGGKGEWERGKGRKGGEGGGEEDEARVKIIVVGAKKSTCA